MDLFLGTTIFADSQNGFKDLSPNNTTVCHCSIFPQDFVKESGGFRFDCPQVCSNLLQRAQLNGLIKILGKGKFVSDLCFGFINPCVGNKRLHFFFKKAGNPSFKAKRNAFGIAEFGICLAFNGASSFVPFGDVRAEFFQKCNFQLSRLGKSSPVVQGRSPEGLRWHSSTPQYRNFLFSGTRRESLWIN